MAAPAPTAHQLAEPELALSWRVADCRSAAARSGSFWRRMCEVAARKPDHFATLAHDLPLAVRALETVPPELEDAVRSEGASSVARVRSTSTARYISRATLCLKGCSAEKLTTRCPLRRRSKCPRSEVEFLRLERAESRHRCHRRHRCPPFARASHFASSLTSRNSMY